MLYNKKIEECLGTIKKNFEKADSVKQLLNDQLKHMDTEAENLWKDTNKVIHAAYVMFCKRVAGIQVYFYNYNKCFYVYLFT